MQVRTPSFKRWFGDWEAAAELNVLIGLSLEAAHEKLKALSGKFLVNLATATGMKAQINTVQRNKIVSASAFRKSKNNGFTANEHNTAASMIDKLWKHAEQVSDAQDKNGDVNIKSIKRFVSPLLFTGRDVPVYAWLTIKETDRDGSCTYSIELEKFETLEGRLKEQSALSSSSVSSGVVAKLEQKLNNISNVVDANGEPLVVYYGSAQWFQVFNNSEDRRLFKAPDGTIVASDNREIAVSFVNYYGGRADNVILDEDDPRHERLFGELIAKVGFIRCS